MRLWCADGEEPKGVDVINVLLDDEIAFVFASWCFGVDGDELLLLLLDPGWWVGDSV